MKTGPSFRALRPLAVAAGSAACFLWSGASHACGPNVLAGAVCLLATSQEPTGFARADGRVLRLSDHAMLYAVIGSTYGGNGYSSFNLPDLRGRAVVGAGQAATPSGSVNFQPGAKGGSYTLTAAQVPAHSHGLSAGTATIAWAVGSLSASTSLAGLSASLDMSQVTGSADGSQLTLNASSSPVGTSAPGGNALGSGLPGTKFYTTGAPDTAMNAASIGGMAPVSLGGTASVNVVGGAAATALTGAPALTVSGTTEPAGGSGSAVAGNNMQPSLVLNYLIALQGQFPTRPN